MARSIFFLLSISLGVAQQETTGQYFTNVKEFCFVNQIKVWESVRENILCANFCERREDCNGYCYSKLEQQCKIYDIGHHTGIVKKKIPKTFVYRSGGKDYKNSVDDCTDTPDYYLAYPTNEEEWEMYLNVWIPGTMVYMGVYLDDVDQTWKITNSSTERVANLDSLWGSTEPDGAPGKNCAGYQRNVLWDITCNTNIGRICQNFEPGSCQTEPFEDYTDLKCYIK